MRISKKVLASLLALSVTGTATGITVIAATEHWNDATTNSAASAEWEAWKTEWETVKNNHEQIVLTPGADATKLNFGWYSKAQGSAKVRIAKSNDMSGSTEFEGTSAESKEIDGQTYYSNKVTVAGLEENTTYYYQYLLNGEWSEVYTYSTKGTDNFSIFYVGDPQIGASKGQVPSTSTEKQTVELAARNDSFNWNKTLEAATAKFPNVSFLLSAGDQINQTDVSTPENELQQAYEYAGFLSPSALKSLPVATTIGNHDSKSENYKNHFNNPNVFTEETSPSVAGNGYYFTYGDVLFMVINTNNYNCSDHENLIKKATEANPDVKWKVVMFHQDIYGSGLDHSDSDGMVLRTQLTPIFDKYDIDVVLQGHDHTYSRTYQLTGDGQEHQSFNKGEEGLDNFLSENNCYSITDKTQNVVTDPNGTIYMEANSATGSKFYELIPTQQDYIAARSQTWTPTYSVIDFKTAEDGSTTSFTINTYDVETGAKIDDSYTIVKTLKEVTEESKEEE
ncbi:MAG: metallophosphoesterase, partial [Acutalibacteraceae bacterium]